MNNPIVLPCPKCDSDEVSYGHGGPPWSASVECHADECGAAVIDYRSKSRAITRWNSGAWDGFVEQDEDGFNVFRKEPGKQDRPA